MIKTSSILREGAHVVLSTTHIGHPFDCRFIAADAWGLWVTGAEFSPMPRTMFPWGTVDQIEVSE